MKILVLGNGFDLAHKLPTTYKNFLDFTRVIYEFLTGNINEVNWDGINTVIKNEIFESSGDKRANLFSQEKMWLSLIENNFWLSHFQNCYINDGWIDFENEISRVIQVIEDTIKNESYNDTDSNFQMGYNLETEAVEAKYQEEIIFAYENTTSYNPKRLLKDTLEKLQLDLDKLIRALELYLVDYVGKVKVHFISPDIDIIRPDFILSFNYTNTYNNVYKPIDINKIDFIHGKASSTSTLETNNMVLGVDEYLPEERKDKDVMFVAYKKYYQRIFKSTGSLYKNWVESMDGPAYKEGNGDILLFPDNHEVHIFGHSLDVTDKDVLRDMILSPYAQTIIYYLDKKDFGRKITNLVRVIGPDELVKRTGGESKTIVFKPQSEMNQR